MAITSKFKTTKEAKKAGWFSRRHRTNQALSEVRERRRKKKLKENIRDDEDTKKFIEKHRRAFENLAKK